MERKENINKETNKSFSIQKRRTNNFFNKNKRIKQLDKKIESKENNINNSLEDVHHEKIQKDVERKLNRKSNIKFDNNEFEKKQIITKDKRINKKTSKLKIIPLGGLNEIGKNITAFEYEDEIFIIDCGLAFPDDEMLGVDIVIPDFTYLERNKDKVKALLVTHGHEDHIGAIPYLLKKMNIPVYGSRLTLALIKSKLIEHKLDKKAKLKLVNSRDVVKIGNKISVEFIRVTHSIADCFAMCITTPEGVIVHTGDFKIDYTPIDNQFMDLQRFAEIGSKGVTLLMSESTNVERPGHTMSERSVGAELNKIFVSSNKRIIVATFASNIHRMQQIVNAAVMCKRKVAVVGRSMVNVIKVGTELGYITAPEGTIIDIDKIGIYPPEQIVIITTGSQGEPMAALSRMSAGEHRKVNITPEDLIIFSSSPIPGNEKSVSRVIDELEKLGAEVIYNQLADVHVSGHACQEELKLMLSLIKPKYFMPIHGEYRFLKHHTLLAASVGVEKDNTFIMENGRTLELSGGVVKKGLQVQSGIVLVDGLGVGDIGNIVLKDRQMLSENGMIIAIITMDRRTSNLVSSPEIVTRGFVYVKENEELMEYMKLVVEEEIQLCIRNKQLEWSTIKNSVRESLANFVYKKTKREPMVLPIITEVDIEAYIKNNK